MRQQGQAARKRKWKEDEKETRRENKKTTNDEG